jgi:hypothetical protein
MVELKFTVLRKGFPIRSRLRLAISAGKGLLGF